MEMSSRLAFPMAFFLVLLLVWVNEVCGESNTFNVKDFGAIADGETDNSKALLNAWSKACQEKDQGTVLIPSGTFMVKAITLQGPCNDQTAFQIDGVLQAPSDPSFGTDHWINFKSINGLKVHGNGKLDGQGALAWSQTTCGGNADCKIPPVSVKFNSITNASIQGITSVNSKFFHFNIGDSEDIIISQVKISAPGNSRNTDGIHVSKSKNIQILNSSIATGDDCISIGPGNTIISIYGISCGPGHGISIGSLGRYPDEKNVDGICVRNCTFNNTSNGLRIKTWAPSPPSKVTGVTFQDIVMYNTGNPIIIDQQYCPAKPCSAKVCPYQH
ncbi:unnamed protein product [Ilex paraguariensis]|uniref:Polygalacturonase n=1 Tax=Ilex paraguariensis TaxID=185542 RepID=A0ABC8TDP9_9AQUA